MIKRIYYGIYEEYLELVTSDERNFFQENLKSNKELNKFIRQIKKDFGFDTLTLLILKSIIKKKKRHLLEISNSFEISKQLTYKKCKKLMKENLIETKKRGVYSPNISFCSVAILKIMPKKQEPQKKESMICPSEIRMRW